MLSVTSDPPRLRVDDQLVTTGDFELAEGLGA